MLLPENEDETSNSVCRGRATPSTHPAEPDRHTARDAGQAVAVELLSELSGQDSSIRYRRKPGCIPVSCNVYKCFLRQQREKIIWVS